MDPFPVAWPFGTIFRWRQRVTVDDEPAVVEACRAVPVGTGWEFRYWVRVGPDSYREVSEDDIDAAEDAE